MYTKQKQMNQKHLCSSLWSTNQNIQHEYQLLPAGYPELRLCISATICPCLSSSALCSAINASFDFISSSFCWHTTSNDSTCNKPSFRHWKQPLDRIMTSMCEFHKIDMWNTTAGHINSVNTAYDWIRQIERITNLIWSRKLYDEHFSLTWRQFSETTTTFRLLYKKSWSRDDAVAITRGPGSSWLYTGASWYPWSLLIGGALVLIWMASFTFLAVQLGSLDSIFAFSRENECPVSWQCSPTAVGLSLFLCSLNRSARVLFVSPMYLCLEFWSQVSS